MKLAACLIASAMLAGCASQPAATWLQPYTTWLQPSGSWLEQVGRLPNPRLPIDPGEATALQAEALRLRAEVETIRLRLAAESDRVERIRDYDELRRLDDQLAPIERRLAESGLPSRARRPG